MDAMTFLLGKLFEVAANANSALEVWIIENQRKSDIFNIFDKRIGNLFVQARKSRVAVIKDVRRKHFNIKIP